MNFNDNEKTIMYIAENKKLKNLFLDSLKKIKMFFLLKKKDKINILNTSLVFKKNKRFYDLIVICKKEIIKSQKRFLVQDQYKKIKRIWL